MADPVRPADDEGPCPSCGYEFGTCNDPETCRHLGNEADPVRPDADGPARERVHLSGLNEHSGFADATIKADPVRPDDAPLKVPSEHVGVPVRIDLPDFVRPDVRSDASVETLREMRKTLWRDWNIPEFDAALDRLAADLAEMRAAFVPFFTYPRWLSIGAINNEVEIRLSRESFERAKAAFAAGSVARGQELDGLARLLVRAADRLAAAAQARIELGHLDARSEVGDALLDYDSLDDVREALGIEPRAGSVAPPHGDAA